MRVAIVVALFAAIAVVPARAETETSPLHISADNVSGSHGPEGDVVLLNRNVRITRGRTVITSDAGRYVRNQGMVYLENNVEMQDSTTTVTCDRASYSENQDVVQLDGDVTLMDRDAILHAPSVLYDRKAGRADLFGGVTGSDADRKLRCDQATYWRDSLLLKARGHVHGEDEANKLALDAGAVDMDRGTHEVVATGNPELRAKDDQGREAVVRAIKLRLNTETHVAEAVDSVRIVRDTLQGRADYALFDERANRGWLLGHPRVWDNETSVAGDTLEMWTRERALERVVVRRNATVDYQGIKAGTLGETSRLTGERIDVFFAGDSIDSLVAIGRAHNDYEGTPEAGHTRERNASQGDTITVFFKNGAIDRALVVGSASGRYVPTIAVRDTAHEKDQIQYDASEISYLLSKNRILLSGASHMLYNELELNAREVEYDVGGQTLVARGTPILVDHGDKLAGNIMTYDMESQVGNVYGAETDYEKGLYRGERIRKPNEKELDVMNGSYTTCSLPNPHFRFQAHWMKIYLKDKLVAKPVVFYVRKVPLFALPFWIFPIKPGRHSGLLLPQFELGYTNRAGRFFRNAGYYWAPNDYFDLTLSGDYYQFGPTWLMRADLPYKILYRVDGHLSGSFARQDQTDFAGMLSRSENWDFNADHQQELSPNTRLVARGSFTSSRDYSRSALGRSVAQRLNRFLRSSVALSHNADWASISAFMDRTQDLDADQTLVYEPGVAPHGALPNLIENIPSVSISFPTRSIGSLEPLRGTRFEKPLSTMYLDLDGRFVGYRERRAFVKYHFAADTISDSTLEQHTTTRKALAAATSISDSRRAFGWLNIRPSLQANAVVFDHDVLGHNVVPTGTWSSAMSANTTLYGTFFPHIGPVQGLRHLVTPAVSLIYSPEFPSLLYTDPTTGQRLARFEGFSGIGVSGIKQFAMSFSIDQRLQAKLLRHGQVEKLDNLLSWSTSGSYNFLWKEQHAVHPLSLISSSMLIQPPGVVNASVSWVTDVYSPRPVRSLGLNLGFNLSSSQISRHTALPLEEQRRPSSEDEDEEDDTGFRDTWSTDFAYSYSGGYSAPEWSSTQTLNGVFHYQLSPGWVVDYSASYDVTARQMGTQRFSLVRDLHCWQASFTRTFAPQGEAEYYFKLGVRDQREIFLERGTRAGSIGGIQ